MSTKIRLARRGAKKRPFYRIVVTDSRAARDKRQIEQVGVFDPRQEPPLVNFETDKLSHWIGQGAKPTLTVSQLMKRQGIASDGTAPQSEESSGAAEAVAVAKTESTTESQSGEAQS